MERLKSLCSLPVWVDITWTQLQIRGPEFAPRLRVELALGFDSQSALNGAFRETVVVFLVLLGFFVHLRAAFGVSITVAPVSYDGYCSEVAEIPKKSERGGQVSLLWVQVAAFSPGTFSWWRRAANGTETPK